MASFISLHCNGLRPRPDAAGSIEKLGISQRQEVDYGSKIIKKLGFNIA
jgi:hypothetical protein